MNVLGHRGARSVAPENTRSAFLAALAAGAEGSELDVRLTSDGRLVCLHDPSVTVDGDARLVCRLPIGALHGLPVVGPNGTVDGIPTLEEALEVLAGHTVMVEIKNDPWDPCFDPSARAAEIVVSLAPPGTIVASFHPATIDVVRGLRNDLPTAVITSVAIDPESNLASALEGGHTICSVDQRALTRGFVERAHAAGRAVHAWATDDPERVRELAAMGIDALICDDPGRALAALQG